MDIALDPYYQSFVIDERQRQLRQIAGASRLHRQLRRHHRLAR